MGTRYEGQSATIIGGSIGGLQSGLLLRDLGFSVDVYERTPTELDSRGGGIVLQPEMMRWFHERSQHQPEQLSTSSQFLRYLAADDSIIHEEPAVWRFTSWSTLYRALLSDFGAEHYHLGQTFVGLSQDENSIEVRFANGKTVSSDMAIFADGITSTGRKRLVPDFGHEYSGYIGWRGTVVESELSDSALALLGDSLTFAFGQSSQICIYPIPATDGSLESGRRLINYVWYQNLDAGPELDEFLTDTSGFRGEVSVHPGKVQQRYIDAMRAVAERILPPSARELVLKTEHPYIQLILDGRIPHYAFGRAVLLGDAGFVARPHAAAGTAKAAAEAWSLAEALESATGTLPEALAAWEVQQLSVGSNLVERAQYMGRRSQFTSDWDPQDLGLRFGLSIPAPR